MSKRKQRPLSPRRKRMNRPARLSSARRWLEAFEGKNTVRGYATWFGVDHLCAVKELGMLGVAVDPRYAASLERTHQEKVRTRAAVRARREAAAEARRRDLEVEADGDVAFAVGRNSAAFAYGPTWEQVRSAGSRPRQQSLSPGRPAAPPAPPG